MTGSRTGKVVPGEVSQTAGMDLGAEQPCGRQAWLQSSASAGGVVWRTQTTEKNYINFIFMHYIIHYFMQ